jgi:transposase
MRQSVSYAEWEEAGMPRIESKPSNVEGYPMKQRTYRKIAVKEVDVTALAAELGVARAVFAIDVAKVDMVAAIVAGDGRVVRTVCWKNPSENGLVLALLAGLRRAGLSVEAVMESSGTYGDVLRHQLLEHGVPVYRDERQADTRRG